MQGRVGYGQEISLGLFSCSGPVANKDHYVKWGHSHLLSVFTHVGTCSERLKGPRCGHEHVPGKMCKDSQGISASWGLTSCSPLCETPHILKITLHWLLPHGLKWHFEKYKFNEGKTLKQDKTKNLLQPNPLPILLDPLNLFSRAARAPPLGLGLGHCCAEVKGYVPAWVFSWRRKWCSST